jgi:hypothetical protein
MTSIINTPTRALPVLVSDFCDIPTPNLLASGTNTTDSGTSLIDSNAIFILNGVNLVNTGDVVYCYGTGSAATIIEVIDTNTLILNTDIFGENTGFEYFIYQQSPITGSQNEGCLLYFQVTAAGDGSVSVVTTGNDTVTFNGLSTGMLPVKIKKLWLNGTNNVTNAVALW